MQIGYDMHLAMTSIYELPEYTVESEYGIKYFGLWSLRNATGESAEGRGLPHLQTGPKTFEELKESSCCTFTARIFDAWGLLAAESSTNFLVGAALHRCYGMFW